jgi:maltooligosyltrehalose trehalohydrolase
MAKAFREGYVYSGQYSAYRKRKHGNSSVDIPAHRFVVFSQNHDQVGNRMLGERLSQLVSFEGLKLAAGVVLLSPFIPLLFMGEEYGEKVPFPYFISHLDASLVEAVRKGRKEEFSSFQWKGELPDPQDRTTFMNAKLNHGLKTAGEHRTLLELYAELIRLRKEIPSLAQLSKEHMEVVELEKDGVLVIRRWTEEDEAIVVFHFAEEPKSAVIPVPRGDWRKRLDSADGQWRGPGSQLPDKIASMGNVVLDLVPHGYLLLVKLKGS